MPRMWAPQMATVEAPMTRREEWARQQTPTDDFEWARQQTPADDGLLYHESCMGQQPQPMQMMVMPVQMGQWEHQAQLPVYDSREIRPPATVVQPPTYTYSTREHQRCCPATEPETNAPLRRAVEGAMLPEELTVMRKALAEMQQVRASSMDSLPSYQASTRLPAQSLSMDSLSSYQGRKRLSAASTDSLPSYQASTMDSLPPMDGVDFDTALPSGGVGQTQAAVLMKALTGGDGQAKAEALEQVAASMWPMTVQRHGCRVAQKAFEVADQGQKNLLAEGLRGHIREAVESPHGNHVVQKCIESAPEEGAQLVLDEMRGNFLFFSRRRFGCRVIERLLEHCSSSQVVELAEEVMREADMLIQHPYGNFVIQHMLRFGSSDDQHQIVDMLVRDIYILSKHRVASHVIEAALAHGCPKDRSLLIDALSADPTELALLAQSHYGGFVAREMMRVQADMTLEDEVPIMF